MNQTGLNCALTGAEHITQKAAELKGWRGKTLSELRKLILEAEPDIVEEWKWGTAVWTKWGGICSAVVYKHRIQLYFFKGAALDDPNGLFNSGMDGSVSRAIDFTKGKDIDGLSFQELVREATTCNLLGDLYKPRGKDSADRYAGADLEQRA